MEKLHSQIIENVTLASGLKISSISLSYQIFGQELGTSPVVLVNHALTGNSNVAGEQGWWNSLIGEDQLISLQKFTVICFNIPGNGYADTELLENYQDFTTADIATFFWKGLDALKVEQIYAIIGGSLGGGIAWEMSFARPHQILHLIPIASHWKANDWLVGNVLVQEAILNHSSNPVHDARLHAMLLYRTPQSLQEKFKGERINTNFQVESWLFYHGQKLTQRFELKAYLLMNHLLKTIGLSLEQKDLEDLGAKTAIQIHQIGINSDYFFIPKDNKLTHQLLKAIGAQSFYHEIESIHGHDAFLIEYEQLNAILKPIFGR